MPFGMPIEYTRDGNGFDPGGFNTVREPYTPPGYSYPIAPGYRPSPPYTPAGEVGGNVPVGLYPLPPVAPVAPVITVPVSGGSPAASPVAVNSSPTATGSGLMPLIVGGLILYLLTR